VSDGHQVRLTAGILVRQQPDWVSSIGRGVPTGVAGRRDLRAGLLAARTTFVNARVRYLYSSHPGRLSPPMGVTVAHSATPCIIQSE
jgi:hypothetical protein